MTGATNGEPAFETPGNQEHSSTVEAVIDLFGPSDLLKLGEDFDPAFQAGHLAPGTPAAAFIFGPGTTNSLTDNPAAVAATDPATRLGRATPPFVLFHGSADRLVSPSQTLLLHTALLAHGVQSTRYVLDGAGHGDLAALLGDPDGALPWSTQELLGYIVNFLDKELSR
jgi:acetyl esterase/lipase